MKCYADQCFKILNATFYFIQNLSCTYFYDALILVTKNTLKFFCIQSTLKEEAWDLNEHLVNIINIVVVGKVAQTGVHQGTVLFFLGYFLLT